LAAFVLAFTFAFASIVFTAASGYPGSPAHQLCTNWNVNVLTPVGFAASSAVTLAWGWMLQLIDS
jgi:hypothetical protein